MLRTDHYARGASFGRVATRATHLEILSSVYLGAATYFVKVPPANRREFGPSAA